MEDALELSALTPGVFGVEFLLDFPEVPSCVLGSDLFDLLDLTSVFVPSVFKDTRFFSPLVFSCIFGNSLDDRVPLSPLLDLPSDFSDPLVPEEICLVLVSPVLIDTRFFSPLAFSPFERVKNWSADFSPSSDFF